MRLTAVSSNPFASLHRPAGRAGIVAAIFCAAISVHFLAGCSTPLNISKSFPWSKSDDKPVAPTEMTVIWTDTTLNQVGRPSVRGFGGRLMFYHKDDKTPVKVDGRVTVFAFDETEEKDTNPAPAKKFVFNQDQLPQHYSESKLGHSYSIWLPWDEVGGPPRQISLMVRFEPEKGPAVVSENSRQLLPGILQDGSKTERFANSKASNRKEAWHHVPENKSGIQQVGHEVAEERWASDYSQAAPEEKPSLETITIDVPHTFAEQHFSRSGETGNKSGETGAGQNESGVIDLNATPPSGNNWQLPTTNGTAAGTASPAASAAAAPGAEQRGAPQAHSSRYAPQVRKAPELRPRSDRLRKQPFRASWPSRLPETPRSDQSGHEPSLPAGDAQSPAAPAAYRAE